MTVPYDTVHHGGDRTTAGARGYSYSGEAEKDGYCLCVQSKVPTQEMLLPIFRVGFPISINLIFSIAPTDSTSSFPCGFELLQVNSQD